MTYEIELNNALQHGAGKHKYITAITDFDCLYYLKPYQGGEFVARLDIAGGEVVSLMSLKHDGNTITPNASQVAEIIYLANDALQDEIEELDEHNDYTDHGMTNSDFI